MEKDKTLYMIGNAHLDVVWLWQWQEGLAEVKATFRSALDRMKEYDEFVFTAASASYYAWVEENDPEMFAEIQERVREGRWAIVGGWWIQPDCNTPSGESFVRQGLYGQHYFREKFGKTAKVGYNVDSFGHNGMLPQILRKSGMGHYVFMRPGEHEKSLEKGSFLWRAPDGSSVSAFRIPFKYCTWPGETEEHIRRNAGEIKEENGAGMCFYGVGNHGGGPTRENLDGIRRLNADPALPKLIMASPETYFQHLDEEKLPVVTGDLLHHASGCYSVCGDIKRLNRRAENRLTAAEKLSLMAERIAGRPYPHASYREAWKEVLFWQFHDVLAGTSLEAACEDAKEGYGYALRLSAKGLNNAVQSLSWKIGIPMEENMHPLVVFNPNAFADRFEVEAEVELSILNRDTVLLDEKDGRIPFQLVQSAATSSGRGRICFVAELPSLGWRTFRFAVRSGMPELPEVAGDEASAENRYLRISFDRGTGYITELVKKDGGTSCFAGDAAVPTVIRDMSDTWSHGVVRFPERIGRFQGVQVSCVEAGCVKRVIRVVSAWGDSLLTQDFHVYRDLDYVAVKTRVDWREKHAMLKLVFPMRLQNMRAVWELPYGAIERKTDGEENPMHNFLSVEGTDENGDTSDGLSFLNDGLFSACIDGSEVGLTVLRSPVYANHAPCVPEKGKAYHYTDQGISDFTYALYPHGGSAQAECVRRSRALNEKPIALFETFHDGNLPQCASFLSVDAPGVLAAVLKMAEDGAEDTVLRLVECIGSACMAKVRVWGMEEEISLPFQPYEIKTVRIGTDGSVRETDLLEDAENG